MVPSGLDAVGVILPLWVSCSHVGQYVKKRERLGLPGMCGLFLQPCLPSMPWPTDVDKVSRCTIARVCWPEQYHTVPERYLPSRP